jgi:hypothetical protein
MTARDSGFFGKLLLSQLFAVANAFQIYTMRVSDQVGRYFLYWYGIGRDFNCSGSKGVFPQAPDYLR